MKVMVLIKASKDTEAGVMPSEKLFIEMGAYNQELIDAGMMVAGEGLHPTSRGVRLTFSGAERRVAEGPFPLDQGVVCGFWVWKVASMDEAVAWAKRIPFDTEMTIEIRPIFEAEDFGEEFTPELRAQEDRQRAQLAAQAEQ